MTGIDLADALMFLGRDPTRPAREHSTVDTVQAALDRYGFGRALVSSVGPSYLDPAARNEQVFQAAATDRRIIACPAACPEFRGPIDGDGAYVDELIRRGARAVSFYPIDFTTGLAPQVVGGLFAALQRRRMPMVLFETPLDQVAAVARAYPQLPLVMPQVRWKSAAFLRTFASTPNLYIPIGPGFSLYRGLEAMVAHGGAERVLLASGFPIGEPGAALAYLSYSRIDETDKAQIAAGNLKRLVDNVRVEGAVHAAGGSSRIAGSRSRRAVGPLAEATLNGKPVGVDGVIDMHTHLGSWIHFPMAGGCADDLVEEMDRTGIEKSFASHLACLTAEPRWGNDQVIDAITRFPDRLLGYAVCWPVTKELGIDEIRRCLDAGMRGMKMHSSSGVPYVHDGYRPVWELADERKLPVLLHTWGDMADYQEIFDRYPNVPILLGHAGCTNEQLYVDFARRYPNVHLELCHSAARYGIIEYLVREVGAERILYGSDAAVHSFGHQLGRVVFADISQEDKRLILATNARSLLDRAEPLVQPPASSSHWEKT